MQLNTKKHKTYFQLPMYISLAKQSATISNICHIQIIIDYKRHHRGGSTFDGIVQCSQLLRNNWKAFVDKLMRNAIGKLKRLTD